MIFLYFLQAVKSLEFYCFHSKLKSLQFFELSAFEGLILLIEGHEKKISHLLLGNFFPSFCSFRLKSFELKSSFHVKFLGLISEIWNSQLVCNFSRFGAKIQTCPKDVNEMGNEDDFKVVKRDFEKSGQSLCL